MQLTGRVLDSSSGAPIGGVTVWSMAADGRSANVLGYADSTGAFNVSAPDGLQVMFSADNYTSASFDPYQIAESNSVQLDSDKTATLTASIKFPSWLLIVLGIGLIVATNKKR